MLTMCLNMILDVTSMLALKQFRFIIVILLSVSLNILMNSQLL